MGSSDTTKKLKKQIQDVLADLKKKGVDISDLEAQVKALEARQVEDPDEELRILYEAFRKNTQYVDPSAHECPEGQVWSDSLGKCVLIGPPPPGPITKPVEGKEQPEKGGNKDPSTWKIVNMTKDPKLFKVVDNQNINIVVEFTKKEIAQQYIDWAKQEYQQPPDHTCPSGQTWNPATGKCEDLPQPPSGGGILDEVGIQKLYQDDTTPLMIEQKWFLGLSDAARLSGKGQRKDMGDGVIQITPDPGTNPASARIYIRTTNPSGLDQAVQNKIAVDWKKMAELGYMVGPEDFCDYEDSSYYKITKTIKDDEFTKYGRGGAHPHGGFPDQCCSCCNKAQVRMANIDPRAAKEYHHANSPAGYGWSASSTNVAKFDLKGELGGSMVGKMIGQKLVQWNEKDSTGKIVAVHIELYFDTASKDLARPDLSKQNWRLWCEWIDRGAWKDPPQDEGYISGCNAIKDQMITWGGPYVADRLDDNIWELHARSVRPILPQKLV